VLRIRIIERSSESPLVGSVNIVTELDAGRLRFSFRQQQVYVSLLRYVGSGIKPATYQSGTLVIFSGDKQPGRESRHAHAGQEVQLHCPLIIAVMETQEPFCLSFTEVYREAY